MAPDTPTPLSAQKRPRNGKVKPASLVTKLADIMSSVDRVEKKGWNDHHKYAYVMEPELFEAVRGGMAERHLMMIPSITSVERAPSKGIVTVTMLYRIIDGDSGEVLEIPWAAEGQDQGDKAIAKAVTNAKYLIMKLFMIPSVFANGEAMDSENHRTEVPVTTPRTPPPTPTGAVAPGKVYVSKSGVAKQGEKDGKPWTLYALELSDGRSASTFDESINDLADHALANSLPVRATLEQSKSGKFMNVVELMIDGDA